MHFTVVVGDADAVLLVLWKHGVAFHCKLLKKMPPCNATASSLQGEGNFHLS